MKQRVVKTVFHLCGAIGGGAKGFKKARAEVAGLAGEWQCLGSIDIDEAANRDFERLIGVRATTMDLMDRAMYLDHRGHEPPPGWREATPEDLRRAAQYVHPNAIFFSPPCKGFSGLLSEAKSRTGPYVALNKLALRILWLALEAWADDPPEFLLIENVPRMLTRGRHLVDQMLSMMRSYGYAAVETVHDCGRLAGLAQSRKRCLIVARHLEKVPPLLYEPPQRPLRAVGDVLGKMRLPGDPLAGPMHSVPNLHWKTWVRLAFVQAGSDWRSLNRLAVENGHLRDYLLVPEDPAAWHPNVLGVSRWEDSAGTVTGEARPTTGRFSVADIRYDEQLRNGPLGVVRWADAAGTVAGENRATNGAFSVAEPSFDPRGNDFQQYGVKRWDEPMGAVINVACFT
jgi:site-specific DNA-cytosine methylase